MGLALNQVPLVELKKRSLLFAVDVAKVLDVRHSFPAAGDRCAIPQECCGADQVLALAFW
jgi:hypothetical protein